MISDKTYTFEAEIIKNPDMDADYIVVPLDISAVFGRGRVKVHAEFDGFPYGGSVVNMGVRDESGRICYVLGVTKAVRSAISKSFGDKVSVVLCERE